MHKKQSIFNKHEQYLFIVAMINLGFGLLSFGLLYVVVDQIDVSQIASGLLPIVYFGLFLSLALMGVSFIRIVYFYIAVKKRDTFAKIKKSVIVFLTSPIAILTYYLLVFIFALSLASCSAT